MFSVDNNKTNKKKSLYLIGIITLIIITIIFAFIYFYNKNNYERAKKDQNKDIVYTRYKRNIHGSKTEVPKININSKDANRINKEIVDIMNNFLKEEYNTSDYEYSINKNILSVVLIMINNNTETTPIISFKTYNINLNTLKEISDEKLLNTYNTNEVEVSNNIKKQFQSYYNEEIKKGYIVKEECDYNCFINLRNIKDYIEKVHYYVDDNKLYAYKEFNPYSIYEEEAYYNIDSFMFYIKD